MLLLTIKMWTVAIFTATNEVAAVPTAWIISQNCNSKIEMCWWPNVKNSSTFKKNKTIKTNQLPILPLDIYTNNKVNTEKIKPSLITINKDLFHNASDNLLNNLTNDLFLNTTNSSRSSLPSNKSPSLFSSKISSESSDKFQIFMKYSYVKIAKICKITNTTLSLPSMQQKIANNLEIIGNHLVTISGEWSGRKLVELPKIEGCLRHLLPLITMEHYHVLVNMLNFFEHKQKLVSTVISRVLDIIISKQLLMEFTFKGTKTKPAFFESVLFKILDEVTAGLRKTKVMPGELETFDTKLSDLVKHAKRNYEIMMKKYSNINAEYK
ncbi:Uncharacterized protein FWK35_00020511 [Aphis craccivora]|uniref:DUF4806 domain-containing protein n=1 Tax=Aphis craccivora TaxID=307492 RepID=A0A6G0XAT6_APHCR|nr:Uncharacterized protein FWK35_00020511 [Aphis craccivora]